MKVILLEDDQVYEQLMQDFKKLIKEAINEVRLNDTKHLEEEWITKVEAMKILRCKIDKLRMLRQNNLLKSSNFGRRVLYYKPSLYDLLEKHTQIKKHALD